MSPLAVVMIGVIVAGVLYERANGGDDGVQARDRRRKRHLNARFRERMRRIHDDGQPPAA